MKAEDFVRKWSRVQQKESAAAQSHFIDVCRLVGHATPHEFDPEGRVFLFEADAEKSTGRRGFADVFYRGKFIWEYKGPGKDLDRAYQQLQLYREDLENPHLLITSDTNDIVIHTNFNNYPTVTHVVSFEDILAGDGVEKLRWVFFDPVRFRPERTQAQITRATADTFLRVADSMKAHQRLTGEGYLPEQLGHFLVRLLFCLFAEDMGLLPETVFTQMVKMRGGDYADLQPVLKDLFDSMRTGGTFGWWRIRHFDGTLFDDDFVPSIPHDLGRALLQAAEQDWSQVDPSIFGTFFERVIDVEKRAQLGAHYTSEDDIMLIVEPVLMEPLVRRWDEVRLEATRLLSGDPESREAYGLLVDFAEELAEVRVLDPACGSGNFLYVALRELLSLQKKVIAFAARRGLPEIGLTVGPEQLYGIEINAYAHELAQITAWIGYLQWRKENGFGEMADPILRPLHSIRRMDAVLAYDEDRQPIEPEWPAADVIIGNPPFLGDKRMRAELGDNYVDDLRTLYSSKLAGRSDLVCYWFERARELISKEKVDRVGLLATNSIRHGTNREVLERIKETGDIFLGWSDREWTLDGAAVRVSIVGFDDGSEKEHFLDGKAVSQINPDLTHTIDITVASKLSENENVCFLGMMKAGPFDIDTETARRMLRSANNPNGRPNSDVVKRRLGGQDITRRPRDTWIIDFGVEMSEKSAALYEKPFEYVQTHVKPIRENNRRRSMRESWWIHGEARPGLREAIQNLERCIVTPEVSKHRVFAWIETSIIPDHKLHVFARDDDYFFGVLHSKLHELWSLAQGSWLGVGNDPSYSSSRTFGTFTMPWPPGEEPDEAEDKRVAEIARWARELVQWREAWLNPPRTELYAGVGNAYEKMLKNRTLTNLYNGLVYFRETVRAGQLFNSVQFGKETRHSVTREEIEELDDIHRALDRAVLDAYGWGHGLSDDEILERLLALNLERAALQE